MKKGDIVEVHAFVWTKSNKWRSFITGKEMGKIHYKPEPNQKFPNATSRSLHRSRCNPWKGMVVGTSVRITGNHVRRLRFDYDNPGSLLDQKHHKVIMVVPIDMERWIEPVPCLEEDLKKCNSYIVQHNSEIAKDVIQTAQNYPETV